MVMELRCRKDLKSVIQQLQSFLTEEQLLEAKNIISTCPEKNVEAMVELADIIQIMKNILFLFIGCKKRVKREIVKHNISWQIAI